MKKFKITRITESTKVPGNRIFKLNCTTIGNDIFKTKKSETYFLTGRNADLEVDQEVQVNLNLYNVQESKFLGTDGTEITTKWLVLKA